MPRAGTLPLYVGGFLGPFGGGVVAVLVPQLRDAFDATTAGVAASIPAYLVPFAALQLVSGTSASGSVAGAWSGRATSSTRCCWRAAALAPSLGAFLVIRALQGSANAFLTPLLLAGLADEVPPRQIGRAVGTFAAVQTAAVALAPLGGGALGAIDWRLAFLSQAVVAVGAGAAAAGGRAGRDEAPRLRAVFTRRVGLLSGAAFTGYAGVTGVGFLVAVLAADEFGLSSVARGVLLAGFGVAGMVVGRAAAARSTASAACRSRYRGGDLRRARRAARGRADAGDPRPAVVRRRARLRARLGGGQRARGRGRAGQPGGRDERRQRLQVRRQRGRAADVAAALPRRSAARLPGRRGARRADRCLHRPAARGRLEEMLFAALGDSFSSFFDAVGSFFSNLAAVQWLALLLALVFSRSTSRCARGPRCTSCVPRIPSPTSSSSASGARTSRATASTPSSRRAAAT